MLDSALGWIGQIAEWVGKFVPRWELLDVTHAGLKIVRGRWTFTGWRFTWLPQEVIVCDADRVHWWWPVTTCWFEHPVARQTLNLKSQTITVKGGDSVIVGGLVVFKVRDIKKLLTETYDADAAISDISLTAVHTVVARFEWAALNDAHRDGSLDAMLKKEATAALSDTLGVTVLKVTLTDLAKVRVYKVVQATTQD